MDNGRADRTWREVLASWLKMTLAFAAIVLSAWIYWQSNGDTFVVEPPEWKYDIEVEDFREPENHPARHVSKCTDKYVRHEMSDRDYKECLMKVANDLDKSNPAVSAHVLGIDTGLRKRILIGKTTTIDESKIASVGLDPRLWARDAWHMDHQMKVERAVIMYVDKVPSEIPIFEGVLLKSMIATGSERVHRLFRMEVRNGAECEIINSEEIRQLRGMRAVTVLVPIQARVCDRISADIEIATGGYMRNGKRLTSFKSCYYRMKAKNHIDAKCQGFY